MKSKLLSAVIGAAGLTGLTLTSQGQGSVDFSNYDCTPYYPIIYGYGTGPLYGTLAGTNAFVELGYALGANQTMGFTLVPASITTVAVNVEPGYFTGGTVIIPGYTSGPITFEILAWVGPYGYAGATANNYYAPYIWTEPSIAAFPKPDEPFTALPGDIILISAPEPSTLTLAGFGVLTSLVAFRRKQS